MGLKYLKGVSTLSLDRGKCRGCGMCLTVCPHRILKLAEGKAYITDSDLCMECGACQMNCSYAAINVDAGVGCAAAVINGIIKGSAPSCGCGEDHSCC